MKTLAELQAIREQMKNKMNIREESEAGTRIVVGMATCGIAAGARPVLTTLSEEVANASASAGSSRLSRSMSREKRR